MSTFYYYLHSKYVYIKRQLSRDALTAVTLSNLETTPEHRNVLNTFLRQVKLLTCIFIYLYKTETIDHRADVLSPKE